MKLRDYQRRTVDGAIASVIAGRNVVVVSPTGSGKTVMGAAVVAKCAGRVLWLAHRKELLSQAAKTLTKAGVKSVAILSGDEKPTGDWRVLVASVDSMRGDVPLANLVVVDEAHRTLATGYRRITDALPGVPVVGLTATPWRLDGKGLRDVYAEMIVATTQAEMFALKHAIEPKVYGIPKQRAEDIVAGVATQAGDYAVGDLSRAMVTLVGDVVAERERLAEGKTTIVFAVDRKHASALADRFGERGITTAYLDGSTPKDERAAIIAGLGDGSIEVVVNVDVLSEGTDIPEVQCISFARPTKSRTRWLQGCGRAARPYGGEPAIILDHAGNCYRHDLPQTDHVWTLDGKPKGDGGSAPVRCCPSCEAMVRVGSAECPECGIELGAPERTVQELERERLEELSAAARKACCAECGVAVVAKPSVVARGPVRCDGCRTRRHPKASLPCSVCGTTFEIATSQYAKGSKRCASCRRVTNPRGQAKSVATCRAERRVRLKAAGLCFDCGKRKSGKRSASRCNQCHARRGGRPSTYVIKRAA